ncbi:uncharacterized protein PSFLO_00016 [Pseudozyma flocculosa]|uniref:Uncharacterized protein n=1 Tax=Pseudozyma flocculosa TaxID=84751 RepID=A0A5C3ES60_9BASI|nr:uncharacterized protein PSFLO_00016 [Pseudozyma flocculosa]
MAETAAAMMMVVVVVVPRAESGPRRGAGRERGGAGFPQRRKAWSGGSGGRSVWRRGGQERRRGQGNPEIGKLGRRPGWLCKQASKQAAGSPALGGADPLVRWFARPHPSQDVGRRWTAVEEARVRSGQVRRLEPALLCSALLCSAPLLACGSKQACWPAESAAAATRCSPERKGKGRGPGF